MGGGKRPLTKSSQLRRFPSGPSSGGPALCPCRLGGNGTAFRNPWMLPLLVFAEFAGTSLWFATNAVLPNLEQEWGLGREALGHITSAVQLGFICGTLLFSVLGVADRFSGRKLFAISAFAGALTNAALLFVGGRFGVLLTFRFLTGIWLSGIYPVGLKLAAASHRKDEGGALGWMVGALVLGSALPHGMRGLNVSWSWQSVTGVVSGFAALGGGLVWLFVEEGPAIPRTAKKPGRLRRVWSVPAARGAMLGYFGHMWELYAFWTFLPLIVSRVKGWDHAWGNHSSLGVFLVFGFGCLGCIAGGRGSSRNGSANVAQICMTLSCLCCLASPWALGWPFPAAFVFLLIWGAAVVADSPQFSALVSRAVPPGTVGSALTFMNAVGFLLTIISIETLNLAGERIAEAWLLFPLAIGPALGLWALRSAKQESGQ